MKEVIINNENEGKRLDVFLTEILDESRSFILKNIKASNILVNDKSVKGGYLLKTNDRILIKDLTIDDLLLAYLLLLLLNMIYYMKMMI